MANKTLLAAQKAYKRGNEARNNLKQAQKKQAQKKKKKKKEEPKQYTPKPSPKPSQKSSQKASNKPQTSKKQTNVSKPANPWKPASTTNMQERYKSYQKSKLAPKTTTKPKKYDALADARQAYKKGRNITTLGTKQTTTTTKAGKTTHKSVNALTRSEFARMEQASRYGKKLGNNLLKGGKRTGQKDIREKVGSKTAESAYKSKFATGVMQGSGFTDVIHSGVGTYNKSSKELLKKTKESKAYLGGYVAGQIGGMGLTKTAAAGRAIAGMGKGVAKATSKNLGKQFAKNRAGEMLAESPMNMLDAVKLATDENGKVDKKELAKGMLLNTALTGGAGGALEAAGMKRASSNVKKLKTLLGKQRAGTITKEELKKLDDVRAAIRKSAKNTDTLSGELSARSLEDVRKSIDDARIERGKAKAEARAPRVEAEFEQAKKDRTNARLDRFRGEQTARQDALAKGDYAGRLYEKNNSVTKNMTEVQTARNKISRAQKSIDKINAAEAEAKNLPSRASITAKINETEELLRNLKAKRKNPNVPQKDVDEKIRLLEERRDRLRKQEGVAWRAETQKSRKTTLQKTIKRGQKEIADINGASKSADELAEAKAAPAKPAAVPKERTDIDRKIENAESTLKKISDPDEYAEAEQRIENLKAERDGRTPKDVAAHKAAKEATMRVDELQIALDDADDAVRGARKHAINSEKKHGKVSPETQAALDVAEREKKRIYDELQEAKKVKKEADAKIEHEQYATFGDEKNKQELEKVNLAAKEAGEELTDEEKNVRALSSLKEQLADIDDQITLNQRKLAQATGDDAGIYRKEIENLRQQRMVLEAAIERNPTRQALMQAADEINKAITQQKKGFGKLIAKVNRGFVDSFGDWESVFRNIDDAQIREQAFAHLQKLRMSRSEAGSKVFDEFLNMYEAFGLVGRKNKQKLADFEQYTFLKHELERINDGTGFTGMSPEAVEDAIASLEKQYGESITKYQQRVVKYFDSLLDEDVKSGFDTAEHVKELRGKFKNYVPTFRDVDGVDAISRAKPYEEINFHRVHAAVGGDDWDVLPLHKQAMQKTQATLIRKNENELVSFVAEIAQVNRKDLVSGKTPKEYLESTTMTARDPKTGKCSVAYFVNGEKKSLQISEGMYKGIRQWTGEDRVAFMNCKLINTVSGKINRWFKDWITDYSLIFGARNFIRDIETGLFYSSHPIRFARNLPRAAACVLADTKAGKALLNNAELPEGFRNYLAEAQALTQAYKRNGGKMSQLVSESDPYVMLKRLHRKNGPLGVIREINSTIEMIPRMAEFSSAAEEAAMKRAGIPKSEWYKMPHNKRLSWLNDVTADADTMAKSMNRAKEITLNFDRSGYIGRWLNSTFVPFFNPAVQGFDKLTRVLARDNHTAAEWTKMVVMFGVIGQGSEILFNTIYADNENYKRLTDYEKTGYYHIPMELFGGDKDSFLKIPKAREVAATQGPLGWYLQHVKYQCAGKDENLFKSFKSNAEQWWQQIGPVNPVEDNIFYTPIRIARNQTWYGGNIESYADQEKIAEGKSDEVWDENTSAVAKAINKMLISAPDKLKFLGISDAQIRNMKQKAWSPKKIDDLMDSYLGVIYDMGIKNTSMRSSSLTDSAQMIQGGDAKGGAIGLGKIFTSSFANAFVVDSVMSNSYRSNMYARTSDLQSQLDKMTEGLAEDSDEYKKVVNSKEYKEINAAKRRLNQSFSYTSINYDSLMSDIYMRQDMTPEQKNYWAKRIKTEQNKLLYGRQQGDDVANADPMAWGYTAKRKDGSRLFSNDSLLEMCSFTYNDGNNATLKAWDNYKQLNPKDKSGKSFMEVTLAERDVNRFTGEPLSMVQYNVAAYAIESQRRKTGKTYELVTQAYEPYENDTLKKEVQRAGNYFDYGGNLGRYKYSHKAVVQAGIDLNLSTYGGKDKGMESWDIMNALARGRSKTGKRLTDLAYYAEGKYVSQRMNAARCLASDKYKKLGVDTENVNAFCKKYDFSYKGGDRNSYPKPEEVEAAIRKDYKDKPQEVQAAVFEEICGTWVDNPFGKIGDYSLPGDTGITDLDKGGWGRRGRRGHWHGWGGWGGWGGGSGSGATPDTTTDMSKYNLKLNVKDYTKKSNVDDAYRRKMKKLREQSRKV